MRNISAVTSEAAAQKPARKRPKGEETRARILAAALDLFREQGFEAATMRDIAVKSGVATGAAYYYFDSKDAIVLAFYDQAQREMDPLLEQALAGSKDLKERVRRILDVKFRYFEPSRRLLGALAAHTDPAHALSPFGPRTQPIRENDIRFFAQAIAGSRTRVPEDLETYLPRLLWMYQMGLILFWIYDRSPEQRRTAALVDKSLYVIIRLIQLAGLPLMRPVRRLVRELMDTVTE